MYYLIVWSSEDQNESRWAKIKMLAELDRSLEVLRENLFPSLFQLLEAPGVVWSVAHFPVLKASNRG